MTTISIRIDEKLKKEAGKVLADIGLDTSSAIKVFLTRVVREQGLPFRPTRDLKTIKEEWDREVADALKNGKGYTDVKHMMRDLLKGK